jgi:hypothetical protein
MGRVIGTALLLFVGMAAVVLSSGCASNLFPGGPSVAGVLYTGVTDPAQALSVAVDASASGRKQGSASASAILGLVATGDASVEAAMRNGGITKVHHVDHKVELVLGGIWARATTIVRGE